MLAWVDAFNRADVDALAALYHADAINHQVAESPVHGREAIRAMFKAGFDAAEMVCIRENLFADGEWGYPGVAGPERIARLRLFPCR